MYNWVVREVDMILRLRFFFLIVITKKLQCHLSVGWGLNTSCSWISKGTPKNQNIVTFDAFGKTIRSKSQKIDEHRAKM